MRIGLFHASLPGPGRKPSGVDVAVHQLANALARTGGDHVTVLSLSPPPPDAAYRHRQLFAGRGGAVRGKLGRLTLLPAALNRLGLGEGLDVLHLHGDDWFYVHRTCPTVRTLHGSALHEARTATSLKRQVAQRAVYGLEHLAARLATLSLGVGPDTVRLYNTDWLIDNGVDLARFRPGPKWPTPRVLFVGTWAGRKRGSFLYDRFVNVVRPAVPGAELIMVSDKPPPVTPGVSHVVTPSDDQLADLYRSAWVFAYPSAYEGFGIPYLEAMASGTAVLASPNDGADYVLKGGALGRIASDADFGNDLVALLRDGDVRDRMAADGRRAAEAMSWDAVARQHRRVYRAAIDQWHDRPVTAAVPT